MEPKTDSTNTKKHLHLAVNAFAILGFLTLVSILALVLFVSFRPNRINEAEGRNGTFTFEGLGIQMVSDSKRLLILDYPRGKALASIENASVGSFVTLRDLGHDVYGLLVYQADSEETGDRGTAVFFRLRDRVLTVLARKSVDGMYQSNQGDVVITERAQGYIPVDSTEEQLYLPKRVVVGLHGELSFEAFDE